MGSGRSWWSDVARGAASSFYGILTAASLALALVTVSVTASLAQSVSMTATPDTFTRVGDTVRFDFVIDTGSYSLTTLDPAKTSIKERDISCNPFNSPTGTGAQLFCTATYQVDAMDVMSGQFTELASFTGLRLGGIPVSFQSNPTVVRAVDGGPVVISVTSSPNPSIPGQEVAVTATVSSMGCNAGQSPSGSVNISIGSQSANLGLSPTGPVSPASSATFRTTTLASGTYQVNASYSGGGGCSTGTGSGSSHTVDTNPTVTINQAATQADPTSRSPILFDVVFDKPIVGFSAADIQLSGTAGATNVVITGSGP
ncbi:Ig-like domain repeat protein, partial [Agrobacterium sp. S2]|nr:Ig-like domain repeat protein [Agrobacterium sp. S2]